MPFPVLYVWLALYRRLLKGKGLRHPLFNGIPLFMSNAFGKGGAVGISPEFVQEFNLQGAIVLRPPPLAHLRPCPVKEDDTLFFLKKTWSRSDSI